VVAVLALPKVQATPMIPAVLLPAVVEDSKGYCVLWFLRGIVSWEVLDRWTLYLFGL
jgi:hypothetical protein